MRAFTAADQVEESCASLVYAVSEWNAGSPEAIERCREQLQKTADLLKAMYTTAIARPESARGAATHLNHIKELTGTLHSRMSLASRILRQRCDVENESSLLYRPGGQEDTLATLSAGTPECVRIEA